MASDYRVGVGHGIALGSLVAVDPQPRTDATTQPVQRSDGISGSVHEQGLFIDLLWDALFTATEYQGLLTAFGLTSALYSDVTVYVPNAAYTYARYNGVAIRPEQGATIRRSNYYIRDVTIRIKNLVAL